MRNYLLLTPGPLSTSESVRQAMLQDWCTWDKDYNEGVVTVIREQLLKLAGLDGEYTTVLFTGKRHLCRGSHAELRRQAAGQAADRRQRCVRQAHGDIARRHGLNHVLVSLKETAPVTPEAVRRALEEHPDISHLAMVHCETTTGILNPVEAVARAIRGRGLTFIVDAMSSFGGIPIDIRKLGIDFLVSSANKCIQGVPGFGFVIARRSSLSRCEGVSRSLSLDLYDQWAEMEKGRGKWRFTSPTHVVRAFFQAVKELEDEGGVEARHDRYRENHAELVEGMRRSGFRTLLPDELQSPIITSFLYPEEDFDFQKFYEALKERGFVIYPGKISEAPTFRIGNIGDVFPDDFRRLAEAVADIRRNK